MLASFAVATATSFLIFLLPADRMLPERVDICMMGLEARVAPPWEVPEECYSGAGSMVAHLKGTKDGFRVPFRVRALRTTAPAMLGP